MLQPGMPAARQVQAHGTGSSDVSIVFLPAYTRAAEMSSPDQEFKKMTEEGTKHDEGKPQTPTFGLSDRWEGDTAYAYLYDPIEERLRSFSNAGQDDPGDAPAVESPCCGRCGECG